MPFSVSQMIVDGQEKVIALDWAYTNADGTLSNQHKLLKPYGSTPLDQVTEEMAVGWLEEQLQNTAEDFDQAIANRKAQVEYEQTLVAYEANSKAAPTHPQLRRPPLPLRSPDHGHVPGQPEGRRNRR